MKSLFIMRSKSINQFMFIIHNRAKQVVIGAKILFFCKNNASLISLYYLDFFYFPIGGRLKFSVYLIN